MRSFVYFFVVVFMGCSPALQDSSPPLTVREDHRPTEAEPAFSISYLAVDNQEETAVQERYFVAINNNTEARKVFQIKELYQALDYWRNQLFAIAIPYNLMIDRLLDIHNHPDLGIDLEEIPEKVDFRWFIPVEVRP